MAHIPVLLKEVLDSLQLKPGDYFIDCTAGEGGHTLEGAKLVGNFGRVLAIERDPHTFRGLEEKIKSEGFEERIDLVRGNFKNIEKISTDANFLGSQAILFDLGFSSQQIEESGRGFSFQRSEILDMRFNPNDSSLSTAADILNGSTKEELAYILKEFGEERRASQIAEAVISRRKKQKIETTDDLVSIIASVISGRGKIHPATKTFQALRIVVNQELENIEKGLEGALEILSPGGRISVISFHSIEDRLVKNIFRDWERAGRGLRLNKKVIKPSQEEIKDNPRSRSSKLRIFSK